MSINKTNKTPLNLNGKVLVPVIDFNFVVNTDIGLIRFIRKNFQDDRAFKLDILNKSDRDILSLLYSRKNINPLSIISTEDNIEDIDGLYKSFLENYKKDIINHSTVSKNIDTFVKMVGESGMNLGVSPYITFSDELEKEEFSKKYKGFSYVKKTKSNVSDKDPYYIKDYSFFTDIGFESVKHKKIYMLPLQYSIDYFENVSNNLTSRNVYTLIGTDYRVQNQGGNNNDNN